MPPISKHLTTCPACPKPTCPAPCSSATLRACAFTTSVHFDQKLSHDFALAELPEHLHGFLTGYRPDGIQRSEDPANTQAAKLMAKLHDALLADGYAGHPLEVLLCTVN